MKFSYGCSSKTAGGRRFESGIVHECPSNMQHNCPECDSNSVTIDPNEGTILGSPIVDFVLEAKNGDTIGVTAYCWECEWEERKEISITVTP